LSGLKKSKRPWPRGKNRARKRISGKIEGARSLAVPLDEVLRAV
jgi:hypothetical protein